MTNFKDLKIAVAGTGYVGLSIATLLSQHHRVTAVDVIPEKADLINRRKSPIQDEYIEKYLAEKELSLTATTDGETAIAFNPQFEIASLLKRSSEQIDPLVFRLKDIRKQYYDIVPLINNCTEMFYFFSSESQWDKEQSEHINLIPNLHKIRFKSKHHGIPFLKAAHPRYSTLIQSI